MDILAEFFFELLFEVPFDMAMDSRRLKIWVKTLLFCLLGGALDALFLVMCISCWQNWDGTVRMVMSVITAGWTALVVLGAIHGHRKKWKN